MRVAAVVQCTFSNLLARDPTLARRAGATGALADDPALYVMGPLRAEGGFDALVLAVPDLPENAIFQELASRWGAVCVPGAEFDVTARLLAAARAACADVIVRVLLHRFYLDGELVRRCVRLLETSAADYVNLPADFNINFGGDVLRTAALARAHAQITALPDEYERARHLFRPWHWMETHPADFRVVTCEDVPVYAPERIAAIQAHPNWSERSRYGGDFQASEYHVIGDLLAPDDVVLDLACGYGESTEILGRGCWRVVGVDRDPELIAEARRRFGHRRHLTFVEADAQEYVHPGEAFDAIVSLHTLEHVDADRRMLVNARNMLRPGGRLILEVPLATRRPFPVPHNPHHLREYTRAEIEGLVADAGFLIDAARGVSRGIYTDAALAREAIQLHAHKPDAALWVHEPAERVLQERAAGIRALALESIAAAGSGHPGGSLSCAEVLACLYFEDDPALRVTWDATRADRHRVVLSKGHACPAWYAALHLAGILPESPVGALRRLHSRCPGHPEVGTPGVDAPSGSLGNGLSVGVGMAVGLRHQGIDRRVFVLLGDGDLNEGATWEALAYAAHHRLRGLTAIVDANGRQGEASTGEVLDLEPLVPRLAAFGWQTLEIHGHDIPSIRRALRQAAATRDRPTVIVARTVKGAGVSFMEDVQRWHGSLAPSPDELRTALGDVAARLAAAGIAERGGAHA